jgi:hypothetical protein
MYDYYNDDGGGGGGFGQGSFLNLQVNAVGVFVPSAALTHSLFTPSSKLSQEHSTPAATSPRCSSRGTQGLEESTILNEMGAHIGGVLL